MSMMFLTVLTTVMSSLAQVVPSEQPPDWWEKEIVLQRLKMPEDKYCGDISLVIGLVQSGLPVNYLTPPVWKKDGFDDPVHGFQLPPRKEPWIPMSGETAKAGDVVEYYAKQAGYEVTFYKSCVILEKKEARDIYEKVLCHPYSARQTTLPDIGRTYRDVFHEQHISFNISNSPLAASWSHIFSISYEGGTLIDFLCEIARRMNADPSHEAIYCWETAGMENVRIIFFNCFPRDMFDGLFVK
ncbi:MAG TPA: hypothetical protein PLQ35_18165 [bacterium]|nr:hypothetical protein [bacterium]